VNQHQAGDAPSEQGAILVGEALSGIHTTELDFHFTPGSALVEGISTPFKNTTTSKDRTEVTSRAAGTFLY